MKKTLLATLIIPALFAASAVNAATPTAALTDSLKIGGTISGVAAKWVGSISPELRSLNMDLNMAKRGAKNTIFDLSLINKFATPSLVSYRMTEPSPTGQPGLNPTIVFKGKTDVTADINGAAQAIELNVKGQKGSANVQGTLMFDINMGGAFAVTDGTVSAISNPIDATNVAQVYAKTQLERLPDFATNFPSSTGHAATKANWSTAVNNATVATLLGVANPTKMQASIVATLNNIILSFANADVPSSWTASLPVTVTIQ